MKKFVSVCLAVLMIAAAFPLGAAALPEEDAVLTFAERCENSARAAIVVEPYTGTVLYEKNADEQARMASTTKIMTALLVLERCALDEHVTATEEHAAVEGSSMYLQPGAPYTVEDVLYGLLLASGNDAAAALADHVAGSMPAFAELMNARAGELGLENTHYANSHGLDAPEHYSSARDLAKLTGAAMENPMFCKIFGTYSYTTPLGVTYINHNQLLKSYEGCIGGKTGYTEAAGRILVSVAEREGMRLICVTMNDPDDWVDHAALYDACFAEYRRITFPEQRWQQLEIVSGTQDYVRLTSDFRGLVVQKNAPLRVVVRLPRFVFAPVLAGNTAGSAEIWIDDTLAAAAELYYADTVPTDSAIALSRWERLLSRLRYPGGIYYLAR